MATILERLKVYEGVFETFATGHTVHLNYAHKTELSSIYQEIYKQTPNINCDACIRDMINLLTAKLKEYVHRQANGTIETVPELKEQLSEQGSMETGEGKRTRRPKKEDN